MKKILALVMCVMMLASLAVSTSAAGEILFTDDFTNGFNPQYWIVENNLYFIDDVTDSSNPCLTAYKDGVVSQMQYDYTVNGLDLMYNNAAIVSKIQIRDFDGDGDHQVGFWWRDDFVFTPDDSDPGYEEGEVWNLMFNADNMTLKLHAEGEETPRIEVPVEGVEVGGDWFTLGWRVTAGHMEGFVNNKKVIDYSSEDIAAVHKSPFLLLNNDCYVAFDDIVIATADYDLFDEGLGNNTPDVTTAAGNNNNNNNNNNNAPAETTTVTQIVEVTGADGQVVTDASGAKVTEINVITQAPAAETNTNKPAGGNATATGDATFVVIAAMVVALGCAVIVKKVNVR